LDPPWIEPLSNQRRVASCIPAFRDRLRHHCRTGDWRGGTMLCAGCEALGCLNIRHYVKFAPSLWPGGYSNSAPDGASCFDNAGGMLGGVLVLGRCVESASAKAEAFFRCELLSVAQAQCPTGGPTRAELDGRAMLRWPRSASGVGLRPGPPSHGRAMPSRRPTGTRLSRTSSLG
jgi:hypothetical protein